MKKKKLLKYAGYLLPFFAILLFVIATFVFFGNKKQVEKYTVDISFYDNLSEVALFEDEIENKLKINFEDLHLKNGGEIILDDSGNIKDLTIDFYYKRNNTIYGGQIEKDDNNYCLIVEPLSLTEIEENPVVQEAQETVEEVQQLAEEANEAKTNILSLDDITLDTSGVQNSASSAASAIEEMAKRIREAFASLDGLSYEMDVNGTTYSGAMKVLIPV